MPKFSLRTALVTLALLAIWLGVNQIDSRLDYGVRNVMWLLVFAYPIPCIIYLRGRIQAFWAGFLITLALIAILNLLYPLVGSRIPIVRIPSNDRLAAEIGQYLADNDRIVAEVIYNCVTDLWVLLPCVLIGLLSARIYQRATLQPADSPQERRGS